MFGNKKTNCSGSINTIREIWVYYYNKKIKFDYTILTNGLKNTDMNQNYFHKLSIMVVVFNDFGYDRVLLQY